MLLLDAWCLIFLLMSAQFRLFLVTASHLNGLFRFCYQFFITLQGKRNFVQDILRSCEFLDYSRVRPLRSFIHHMTSTDLKLDVMSLFHLLYILTLLIRKVEYRQVKSRKIVSQNCYALGLLQLLAESTFFLSISWCWFMDGRHYFQSTFQSIRHLRARCFISASIITFINNFFQCRVLRKYLRVQKGNLPLKTIYIITQ